MINEEDKIISEAKEWVKKNKKKLFLDFADENIYVSDPYPTTIFMAGSPGAGKTEFSRRLSETFNQKPVIIDADEIRKLIPGYLGKKAYLYQRAATKGVNILYDYVCKKGLNVVLDGTFAYGDALGNIEHSLRHNRNIEIYFLYQDPVLSWNFTKQREKKEFRNVPKEVFIKAYIKSLENVNLAKEKFGNKMKLNIVIKNFEKGLDSLELNKDRVENYIPKVYTTNELEELLT